MIIELIIALSVFDDNFSLCYKRPLVSKKQFSSLGEKYWFSFE